MHASLLEMKTDIEHCRTAIIQLHKNKQNNNPIHTIINIYRRPHPISTFYTDLQTTIDKILTASPKTSITIQGDININLLKMPDALLLFLTHNGLYTTITTPTRYDPIHHTSSLIDVTLTTLTATTTTAGTISPPITDHLPTYTTFHDPIARTPPSTHETLTTARYNRQKHIILPQIHLALTHIDINAQQTTSQHFYTIQRTIEHVIEQHERTPKPRPPWRTTKLARQIQHQHKLHTIRKNDPTPSNIARHAQYRNELKKKIKHAKRQTLTEQIEMTKNDPKAQAKILKSILPSRSNARTSPTALLYENYTFTDPTHIACALNDHYITIGDKTANTIPQDHDDHIENDSNKSDHPPFTLRHITITETTKTMNKINPNKASDIYKIKPAIIKDLAPYLAPILTTLFNTSIDENEYPDALKYTKVIEIYKDKLKILPANYRPISLLPIIAKILDTLLNNQLMDHLLKHSIISPTQYAFRPDSSTTLALQTITNHLHYNTNQRKPTLAIYIDLSKAYDTISHKKLISKLRDEFNFTPDTAQFFESYFHNRQQTTHTQHAHSATETITHGIPQGSTLSTTFFLLYINNIIQTVPRSKVFTYADDTTLIITAETVAELQALAQSELSNLISYFHSNNLVPNPTKTNYTVFHPRTTTNDFLLTINDITLKQNKHAKLLGIVMQNDHKHQQTITRTIKKLHPAAQSLRYATKLLPRQTMVQLYYAHVFPHLIQCLSIWGTDDKTNTYVQPLIKMQKKLIRIMANQPPRTHTKPIMLTHRILNITNLYIQRVCLEIHPFIHQTKQPTRPEHDHTYIPVSAIHDHHTRHSHQQHQYIPNPNQYGKNKEPTIAHLTQKYTEIWNTLPQEHRSTSNFHSFKLDLKTYLLKKQASEQ
jgi:hypothetical protein